MANSKDNISKYVTSFIGFDEDGGNALDLKSGYTGTLFNNPQRVTGWNNKGNAMSFNGSNQYIQFNGKIIPTGAKSIRFKMKINSYPTGTNSQNILSTIGNPNQRGFVVELLGSKLQISVGDGNATTWENVTLSYSVAVDKSELDLSDGKWHDIFFTWDGTLNTNTVKLFIDNMTSPIKTSTALKLDPLAYINNLTIGKWAGVGNYSFFNGQLDQIEIYDRVISPIPDKYLVQHNSQYKYHDGAAWQTTTPTESNFIQYGMSQLSQITEQQWQELTGDKSLVMWSDFEDKQWMNVVYNVDAYKPKDLIDIGSEIIVQRESKKGQNILIQSPANPQTIYANGDILLSGIETLDSINLLASGNPKVAMSFDSGQTYVAFNNGVPETITDISNGMSTAIVNALTKEQLTEAKGDAKTLRFAYYLSNLDEIDKIELRISMKGKEQLAKQSDYDMSYDYATKTIMFDIKKNGTYSVNYVDTQAN